ncbi:hypothetical protein [Methylobacterium dankookense]|uniref:hypothetical protein n=1 Tax=Methylobacterium dankookense TaxID=560405 RepID=UPI002795BE1D|nr:hypothetical protein [Methylobacterium dankookense]
MSMSVNRTPTSLALSRIAQAASAVAACRTGNPASSSMSTATMRTMLSSSTTRTAADIAVGALGIGLRKSDPGSGNEKVRPVQPVFVSA